MSWASRITAPVVPLRSPCESNSSAGQHDGATHDGSRRTTVDLLSDDCRCSWLFTGSQSYLESDILHCSPQALILRYAPAPHLSSLQLCREELHTSNHSSGMTLDRIIGTPSQDVSLSLTLILPDLLQGSEWRLPISICEHRACLDDM